MTRQLRNTPCLGCPSAGLDKGQVKEAWPSREGQPIYNTAQLGVLWVPVFSKLLVPFCEREGFNDPRIVKGVQHMC